MLFTALATTCSPPTSELQQIETTGVLRVATVNSATTYYIAASGPTGFEYDLARLFAEKLGAELKVTVVHNRRAALTAVADGQAHFAAGLAVTPERRRRFRFTPSYFRTEPEVVVRSGGARPKSLADIEGDLVVPTHTAVAAWLRREHPDLDFVADADANSEELLLRVAKGEIVATIADANLVDINQRYYPELRVALKLDAPQSRAWAFPADRAEMLYNKAVAFLEDMRGSAEMRIVQDRYFGHTDRLGFVGGKTFARIVEERLEQWSDEFQAAAEQYEMDWRLLAAMGYQESHWDPDAVSPTGVRGLMMLTRATAREVGVKDRTDPLASIRGGAEYFDYLRGRLPESIDEPDRTWMALAAYNIGMGHLMDARRLLKARNRDPDRWVNVRTALEWLTQERYYRQTRYGYARGQEAVAYVGNIRAYYDILLWMTSDTDMEMPASLTGQRPEHRTPEERALDINSPAL